MVNNQNLRDPPKSLKDLLHYNSGFAGNPINWMVVPATHCSGIVGRRESHWHCLNQAHLPLPITTGSLTPYSQLPHRKIQTLQWQHGFWHFLQQELILIFLQRNLKLNSGNMDPKKWPNPKVQPNNFGPSSNSSGEKDMRMTLWEEQKKARSHPRIFPPLLDSQDWEPFRPQQLRWEV